MKRQGIGLREDQISPIERYRKTRNVSFAQAVREIVDMGLATPELQPSKTRKKK